MTATTLTLDGVDFETVPACEVADCSRDAAWAGRSLCPAGGHPFRLVCAFHKDLIARRWRGRRDAACQAHDLTPIPWPAFEWRRL
jgi:hypothetical protein